MHLRANRARRSRFVIDWLLDRRTRTDPLRKPAVDVRRCPESRSDEGGTIPQPPLRPTAPQPPSSSATPARPAPPRRASRPSPAWTRRSRPPPASPSCARPSPVTRPPAAPIRSVACSRVSSGSVPVRTSVLPASGPPAGRRPLLLELQPTLAQVGDQLLHGSSCSWSWISGGHLLADARRLLDLLRVGVEQRVDCRGTARRGSARSPRRPPRSRARTARGRTAAPWRPRSPPAASRRRSRRSPSSSTSCSSVRSIEVGRRRHPARAPAASRPASRPGRRCPSRRARRSA